MTGRARRWLVAALALILAAVGAAATGARVLSWQLSRRSGLAVAVGGLGLAWRPVRLVATDLRVADRPGARPSAQAERASIEVLALLRGEHRLALERPRLYARLEPDGRIVLPGAGLGAPATFQVAMLRVAGARVVLAGSDGVRRLRLPETTLIDATLRSGPQRGTLDLRASALLAAGHARVRARRRSAGATERLRVALATGGADLAALDPLASLGVEAGRLRGRVRYARDAGALPARSYVGADGTLRGVRLGSRGGGPRLALHAMRLDGVAVDLLERRVRVERVTGRHGAVVLASPHGANAAWSTWRSEIGTLALAALRVGGRGPRFGIRALHARDLATGRESGSIFVDARLAAGGRLKVRGTVDAARLVGRARVRMDGVALAGVPPGLPVASGRLGGTITAAGPPWTFSDGVLALDDVQVRDGAEAAFGWERLRIDVERLVLAPPRLWLRRATLDGPSVTLRRDAAGLHPLPLLTRALATPAVRALLVTLREGTAAGAAPAVPAALDIAVHGGRVRFDDRLVEPPYLVSLSGIEAHLHEDAGPRPRATDFTVAGALDGGGAFHATGRVDGPSLRVTTDVTAFPLLSLSPYLERAAGVVVRGGLADVTSQIDLRARALEAPTRLAVAHLALDTTDSRDPFPDLLGLPLARVVPLLADGTGRVVLDLPLTGDPRAPAYGLAAGLGQSLRTAVANAITNPLLAEATLARAGGRETMRLPPLAFPADATALADDAPGMLDRLAVLLQAHPSLVITLRGRSGPPDAAARRRTGRDGRPEPAALALARAEHVRERLATGLGVPAARVRVAPEPAPAGSPAVLVEVSG
jgi:hypothetical protein